LPLQNPDSQLLHYFRQNQCCGTRARFLRVAIIFQLFRSKMVGGTNLLIKHWQNRNTIKSRSVTDLCITEKSTQGRQVKASVPQLSDRDWKAS
jgi:hypothetical protein